MTGVSTALVCNSEKYSSFCSCEFANLTNDNNYLNLTQCFSEYVCEYDYKTQEFCSGHGECNFSNSTCLCYDDDDDDRYGGIDCSQKYEIFIVNGLITYGLPILGSLISILCIILMYWLYKYRKVSDVKAMSVTFTQLMLIGLLFISIHCIIVGIGFNEINCVLLEWFAFIGVCLLLTCALLKAYRISSIFSNKQFSPSDLTDRVLLRYLTISMIIDLILLIMYTIFNSIEGGAYKRPVVVDVNENNIDDDKDDYWLEERCNSEPLTLVSYYLLVAYQCILLGCTLLYGNKTSSVSNIFKETTCIYIGSNIGTIFFIIFGVFVLFTSNLQFQMAVRGYGSLFVVFLSLILLFQPKFKSVYYKEEVDGNDGLTNKQRELTKYYEVNLKDKSGAELLLVLDTLATEINERLRMKMLRLEFNSIDKNKMEKLMENLEQLIAKHKQKQQQQNEQGQSGNKELTKEQSSENAGQSQTVEIGGETKKIPSTSHLETTMDNNE